jgi:hypothetical protein
MWIDDAHEAALMDVIRRYKGMGEDAWTTDNTCSGFSRDAWRAATGEAPSDKTKSDSYGNPGTLGNSLHKLNGGLGARVIRRRRR